MAGRNPITAYLLLGSNVGDRASHLREATESLGEHVTLLSASRVYETDAWGDRSQDAYLNQALRIGVQMDAGRLHEVTRSIEARMGRTEKGNYQPRKIDIDILFFGDSILQTADLTIPHPRIRIRRFVLAPLAEIAPDLRHPVFGKTVVELLDECEDRLGVRVIV